MKKAKKTRLHVDRETLRVLEGHQLREVEGGRPPATTDSEKACCT